MRSFVLVPLVFVMLFIAYMYMNYYEKIMELAGSLSVF